MFSLVISYLTTSNLPGFIDLTFQVLFFTESEFISVTSHIHNWALFCFGSGSSFFLELFLHSSPVVYWTPTDLGNSSFSVIYFCLFILFLRFSRKEHWSGLQFPSSVDHVFSELSTMTHPSWVVLNGMTRGYDYTALHSISAWPYSEYECGSDHKLFIEKFRLNWKK